MFLVLYVLITINIMYVIVATQIIRLSLGKKECTYTAVAKYKDLYVFLNDVKILGNSNVVIGSNLRSILQSKLMLKKDFVPHVVWFLLITLLL